ncbi:short-chain dehydrogenase/reductase [Sphingopyxis sp. GW247-27LB]|uniref:short-chain dehydrogenase/reductase n=1 Tax=Sphingopyxis sp. GW247-27LB TaxID=2012632 RepID=UPI000BA63851|nr:short-chain dehydrogenase/reductase [Sphingopyxis sp. GW247-27LB]PAL24200.1 short-chain dehydrogenase [Sphingopyxis sp. GW247-27LB]
MDLELAGRRALVTGASKGIGLATALALADEGCDLVLVARSSDALNAAVKTVGSRARRDVMMLPADLSQTSEVEHVAARAGAIDILVNNAGAIPPGGLAEIDDARWRAAWDLKVFGYISLARLLYPTLKVRRGVIVNVIGSAGERFPSDYIAGASGNAALMAFTRALGRSAPKDGMRVVGINPGPVGTDRLRMLMRTQAERELGDGDRWPELVKGMPFGRFAHPEEIASAVAFLASPRSGYTSGTILTVDGGQP